MLIFNEGVPGAGKTYDAVVEHILPSLRKGRRVLARVNGLNHEAIAAYLELPLDKVQSLLEHVPSAKVRERFRAVRDESGEFVMPDEFRNALIVIDEVHEFYVSGRERLPDDVEQFFAIQRHYGMDVVLITQWYKRMHSALRARIERKNVFQKLTAVGMETKYRVSFWQTLAPDKYEKIGGQTRKYDPAIFPLYKGVADSDVQTEVYKGGARTVWASVGLYFAVAGVMLAIGVFVLAKFFTGNTKMDNREAKEPVSAPVAERPVGQVYQPASREAASAQPTKPPPPPDPIDKMTSEQAYIWRLSKTHRARASAKLGEGADVWGMIEFREKNQPASEMLTTRQLEAMGVKVEPTAYGFKLTANAESIIATQWPTNEVLRPATHELYRLDKHEPGRRADVSEANVAPDRVIGINGDDIAQTRYGQFRGEPASEGYYESEGFKM